jgi:uncharacterized protein (DUF58 family)
MTDDPGIPRRRRGSFRINSRGWLYLVLTTAVAFAAGFKNNNLLFAIFSVLVGLFATSGLLTFLVARRIELSRVLPESVHVGELFAVGVRLKNAKRYWPAFCLKFEDRLLHEGRSHPIQPSPLWLPLAKPGKRIRTTYYLSAQERGWAKLGPVTLTSEFTPGLFTYTTLLPVEDRLLVYPRMGVLSRRLIDPLLSRVDFSELASTAFTPGLEEFSGLREYRPGDNPRRIHWKMSARTQNKLLVREYEDAKIRDAVVFLETYLPSAHDPRRRHRLERAVAFTATFVDFLLWEGYRVRFRAFTPEPALINLAPGRGSLGELLEALALLKPSRVHSLADLLRLEEECRDTIPVLLRIGGEALGPGEVPPRAIVLTAADMKKMMYVPE